MWTGEAVPGPVNGGGAHVWGPERNSSGSRWVSRGPRGEQAVGSSEVTFMTHSSKRNRQLAVRRERGWERGI